MAVGRVKDMPGRQYTVMGPGAGCRPKRLLLGSFVTVFAPCFACPRWLLSADWADRVSL
jgi:hypothetical protein